MLEKENTVNDGSDSSVASGIVPTALTEDVFFIIVDGFSKYRSKTKICEDAKIERATLRSWLNDPNPVGIVKELREAISEIQAAPQRQLFLKAQEILMERLNKPRKTVRRKRAVVGDITGQAFTKLKRRFGEEKATVFKEIVENSPITLEVEEVITEEEITSDSAFRIWSYLREEFGIMATESVGDDTVLTVVHPETPSLADGSEETGVTE